MKKLLVACIALLVAVPSFRAADTLPSQLTDEQL